MMGNENNPGLNFSNNSYAGYTKQLGQWCSTGVDGTLVCPENALGVTPISELKVYYLVYCR